MTEAVSIDHALRDPRLLGAALGDSAPWATWLAVWRAAFREILTGCRLADCGAGAASADTSARISRQRDGG
jgi:hypothetical protein